MCLQLPRKLLCFCSDSFPTIRTELIAANKCKFCFATVSALDTRWLASLPSDQRRKHTHKTRIELFSFVSAVFVTFRTCSGCEPPTLLQVSLAAGENCQAIFHTVPKVTKHVPLVHLYPALFLSIILQSDHCRSIQSLESVNAIY